MKRKTEAVLAGLGSAVAGVVLAFTVAETELQMAAWVFLSPIVFMTLWAAVRIWIFPREEG
jgi:hypothetical protein